MEWKEDIAADFCSSVTDGTHDSPKATINGKKLITSKHLKDGYIDFESAKFISEKDYLKVIERSKVDQFDILFSMIGTIGNIYRETSPNIEYAVKNMGIFKMGGNAIRSKWLYYWLKSKEAHAYIYERMAGSTQSYLTLDSLRKFPVVYPEDINDMENIVSILSSLDRKIELNNKINADLEEMAQAIFKNWFVDFEPFKDGKFVVSELGMIPEGWKVVAFDNILKVTTTKTGKEGIPEYSVTNTGIHPRDEKFTKNLSKSSAKNKLIRKGNLVFGMSREILNWGIMKEEIGGVSSAYNVYIVDEKIVSTTYLEYFIAQRMDYFADLIKPASREGQGVDKALLMKKIICIPPSEVLDVFLEKYNSIMHLTEIRNQENSRLSLLRDTLLPRLMSGELEVPE